MKLGIIVMLGLLFLVMGCIPAEKVCSTDNDCVPATCCHADDAVSKDFAPNCKGILCTAECVPGTIDCRQGEIACVRGGCEAVMNE